MKRFILAFVLATGLTAGLGGCSSSATPQVATTLTTTTAVAPGVRLTKAQLIEKADATCKEFNQKQSELEAPKNQAGIADYLDKNLELFRSHLAGLRALGEPTEDASAYKSFLTLQAALVESLEKKIPEYKKNPDLMNKDTEIDTQRKAASAAASAFGLKECGKTS